MNKRPVLIVGILALGLGLAITLVKTAPKPQKKIQKEVAPLVEIRSIESANTRATWLAGAAVNAKASVNLVAQVSGQVVAINSQVLPGAFVKKGTVLAEIDDRNYRLVVDQKQAALIQAQSNLDVELGQVQNARADYKLSGMQLKQDAKALALREPQLAAAKAAVAMASADLKKAQLDLTRTRLTMPFDGFVMSQVINEGAFVNTSTTAFTLINSEEFWFEVRVPESFVSILDKEHPVEIRKHSMAESRTGKILSVLPQVNENDRQVRVLISIPNPLNGMSEGSVIRYNDYVEATLFAIPFENALRVKTDQLNGQAALWVVDQSRSLRQRRVDVLYKGREYSWVKIDTQLGDQMLLSALPSKFDGMAVRLDDASKKSTVASEEVR